MIVVTYINLQLLLIALLKYVYNNEMKDNVTVYKLVTSSQQTCSLQMQLCVLAKHAN